MFAFYRALFDVPYLLPSYHILNGIVIILSGFKDDFERERKYECLVFSIFEPLKYLDFFIEIEITLRLTKL